MYIYPIENCDHILIYSNLCDVVEILHRMGVKERERSDRI